MAASTPGQAELVNPGGDVLGCEHNEIAAMLDRTVGNSKSQLHKARMRLRKLLRTGGRKKVAQPLLAV